MRLRNVFLFVLLTLIWGTTYVTIKHGLNYFPPVLYAAISFESAGLLFLPVMMYRTDVWWPEQTEDWVKIGIGSTFMVLGYHLFLFLGQTSTVSFIAAIVIGLSPLITAVLSWLLLPGHTLGIREIGGLLLGFLGIIVITNRGSEAFIGPDVIGTKFLGPLFYFCAILFFDLGIVLTKKIRSGMPPITFQVWIMGLGGLLLHGFSMLAFRERFSQIIWNGRSIMTLLYFVVMPTGIAYLIYYELLEIMDPVRLNLVSYVIPVVALLAGWIVLGEVPTYQTLAGFALVLAGMVLFLGTSGDRIRATDAQKKNDNDSECFTKNPK